MARKRITVAFSEGYVKVTGFAYVEITCVNVSNEDSLEESLEEILDIVDTLVYKGMSKQDIEDVGRKSYYEANGFDPDTF